MPVDSSASTAVPVAGIVEARPGVSDPVCYGISGTPVMIGLVLTLAPTESSSSPLLATLRAHPNLRLGEQSGHWMPVTAETDDPREMHRWLEAQPGVRAVDVVFVEVLPEAADPAAHAAGDAARPARADLSEP